MRKPVLIGSGIICLAVAALLAGCMASGPGPGTPVPTHPAPVFASGDVLAGNMTRAGYDTPDSNITRYRAVVLGYQREGDMYVYTFVEPLANGSYRYVLPEGWVAKLGRPRQEFESYGLVKNGTMPQDLLWKAS